MIPDELLRVAVQLAGDDAAMLARIEAVSVADELHHRMTRPRYGSPEYHALPIDSPARAEAIYVAAECWRLHCSLPQVAADLIAEMEMVNDEIARRVRESSWDVASATRGWHWSPSHAEMQERRTYGPRTV